MVVKRLLSYFAVVAAFVACSADLELVTDGLPTIDALLEELELTHLAEKFYASGFTGRAVIAVERNYFSNLNNYPPPPHPDQNCCLFPLSFKKHATY
jgi:hypothetical protein